MKKITWLLAVLLTAVTFIACEGPMGPEGPLGPQGPQGEPGYGTKWYTTSFTINRSDWLLSDGNPGDLDTYFFADKNIPQLTDIVFDEGTVLGYIQTAKDVKNGLPFVLHRGEEQNGKEFLWTQTYDFDFSPGMIRFYVTYSDFSTNIIPDSETFHIVLMW